MFDLDVPHISTQLHQELGMCSQKFNGYCF